MMAEICPTNRRDTHARAPRERVVLGHQFKHCLLGRRQHESRTAGPLQVDKARPDPPGLPRQVSRLG